MYYVLKICLTSIHYDHQYGNYYKLNIHQLAIICTVIVGLWFTPGAGRFVKGVGKSGNFESWSGDDKSKL